MALQLNITPGPEDDGFVITTDRSKTRNLPQVKIDAYGHGMTLTLSEEELEQLILLLRALQS